MKKYIFISIILISTFILATMLSHINNYSYQENFLMLGIGMLISLSVSDKLEDSND